MKILWITSSGWKEGGVENYLALLRPQLEGLGHTVRILSSNDRPDMPHFSDVEYATPSGPLRPLGYSINPSAYRTLRRVLAEYAPDLVHIHTIGHASPAILFALRDVPTVLTVHGPEGFIKSLLVHCLPMSDFVGAVRSKRHLRFVGWAKYVYHRCVNGPLYWLGFRNVDLVITPSVYMQTLVARDGYANVCIPNGTALFAHHPLSATELTPTVVFAGRLETYKGVDCLLRAFAEVLKTIPDARLIIAGDGTEREHLEQLTRDLSLTAAVEFVGHVGRSEVENIYQRAALAVMPSTWVEAFGLSGIEAMSVGRPVVASRVGGIPDWLIDGTTGYLVPPQDTRALAGAIIKLLANPDTLQAMMHNARARAEAFGIEQHAVQILDLYAAVVRQVRSKR